MGRACLCQFQLLQSSVGASGFWGQHLLMHPPPHMVLSWAKIHHVGPAERVLHPETKTNLAIAILQISCSYNVAILYFNLPHPLTLTFTNPPKSIFLGSLMFPILTMCLAHRMHVLLNITGISSMLHMAATSSCSIFATTSPLIACARSPCGWH